MSYRLTSTLIGVRSGLASVTYTLTGNATITATGSGCAVPTTKTVV